MIGKEFLSTCIKRDWETYGLSRSTSHSRHLVSQDHQHFECDILDRGNLGDILRKIEPDLIVHLAAQAFNGSSWRAEDYTHQANFTGTLNLLNCARKECPDAKILLACSSAEYGVTPVEDNPLREDRPLKPVTPYGVSKMACESLGFQYFANYGMKVYLPRLFIHVGTGHPPATAIQNFGRQIGRIITGQQEPLMSVGRLDTARDFIDVRDGVEAMLKIIESDKFGEPINVCNQQSHQIGDILQMMINSSDIDVNLKEDSSLLRHSDEKLLMGDNSKLKSLGWKRKFSMEQTLQDVVRDWVKRCEKPYSD